MIHQASNVRHPAAIVSGAPSSAGQNACHRRYRVTVVVPDPYLRLKGLAQFHQLQTSNLLLNHKRGHWPPAPLVRGHLLQNLAVLPSASSVERCQPHLLTLRLADCQSKLNLRPHRTLAAALGE